MINPSYLGKEKRKFVRVEYEVPVTVRIHPQPDELDAEQKFSARTSNIGAGGVCLLTSRQIAAGTRLELFVDYHPKDISLPVCGEVVAAETDAKGNHCLRVKYLRARKLHSQPCNN